MKDKVKEKYFVVYPNNKEEFGAVDYDTYKEAKEAANEFLEAAADVDGVYYVAKVTEKMYYKRETETL